MKGISHRHKELYMYNNWLIRSSLVWVKADFWISILWHEVL